MEWDELLLEFHPWIKKTRRMMLRISDYFSMGVWLQDIPEECFSWDPGMRLRKVRLAVTVRLLYIRMALWEKALEGQEERDIAMEKEQVDFVEKKWGERL